MKQVLFALMVLVIAAWTAPVFGQEASLLDQVKGKTEAEVVTFMQGLNNDQLASLVAQAVNAAIAEPNNAAVVAQRDLILRAASMVLATKPADQYEAIVTAIQAAAPGTVISKDAQGVLTITPPAAPLPTPPGPMPDPTNKQKNVNKLRENENFDSQGAAR